VSNKRSGGIYIERELYLSDAFLSLSKNAMKALIAFLDSRKREQTKYAKDKKGNKRKPKFTNLNSLIVTYSTFETDYKISRPRIPGAIDELLAKGFIKIVHKGGACAKDTTKYAWSNNFLLWRKGAKPFQVRPKCEHHGFQGKMLGAVAKYKKHNTSK